MSSEIILKVEDISKQYRLGLVGTGTISHDLNRWWSRVRGKEDPYLKVGEANVRSEKGDSEYVWAIKDINFEVKKGEVLGIIGKNGAGKSTLLKILSRVTSPTTGQIKTKGRIASLLEVGTGFHPEMTGRENIYLNGAILGMTKAEINSKIDEIIEFSGCLRYVDTPVKRYSSGMRVRLAFAVAAFLEPDILVVDEVLAVGDAEFQKKAIGKMQDISNSDGRTVLFVSHNMAAIQDLCSSLLVLSDGKIVYNGNVKDGVSQYLNQYGVSERSKIFEDKKNTKAQFSKFEILDNSSLTQKGSFKSGESIVFRTSIKTYEKLASPIFSIRITDVNNTSVITWRSNNYLESPLPKNISKDFVIEVKSENLYLLNGVYNISIGFSDGKEILDVKKDFLNFEILSSKPNEDFINITKESSSNSIVFYPSKWKVYV